ncbi:RNA polymerase sporulation-specific sigma factor (sigma-F) [Candidatus Hydrogenisulfobacillus filiaventi]|uniref:RNA polymerase sigma factor n=1 Tax=Candidatus Hydrogenisulfobacillus filiaventi TaxID=2707344 RepID=A0A6F8ZFB5_9FIRM|nr:SigB/SigF/SigG family RNA polymerase sigma factor [Bacillota bacterium]CAB1128689.1 RNA polymerase sporulation-specific sigma factor (sigma-F) [Candidatus Hydrogenisulfobacillus filiaventi]
MSNNHPGADLDPPSEAEWFRRAQAGDPDARRVLVERHWNLVWHIVHRFQGRGYEAEDLFQVGAIGLLKAIDRFEVERGLKFSTYAVPLIMGEIRRYLRDDQPLRVSRSVRELGVRIEQTRQRLSQAWGRDPTVEELAGELGLDPTAITEAMEAVQPPASLHQTLDSPHGGETRLLDNIPDPRSEAEWLEQLALTQAFQALDARDRYILQARFAEGRTQSEVAERLHISQVQVSRLERRALERLRRALSEETTGRRPAP